MTDIDKQDSDWARSFDLCMDAAGESIVEEAHYAARSLGVSPQQAEALVFSLVENIAQPFPPLTVLELFLTDNCNMACPYCFVEGKTGMRRMSLDVAQGAFEFFLRESAAVEDLGLVLMGGEPMLEFEMLRTFLPWAHTRAHALGKKVRVDMTSNGTLIDDEKARILRKLDVKVLLSIDGSEKTQDLRRPMRGGGGSYSAVLNGLRSLRRHQAFVGARVTVVPADARELLKNVQALWELGVRHFLIGPATGITWDLEDGEALVESLRSVFKWWRHLPPNRRPRVRFFERALEKRRGTSRRHTYGCRAGRNGVVITPEGDIYPCSKVLGVDGLRGVLRLGSIAEGFTELETRLQLNGLAPVVRGACWNCALQNRCMGGCYAVNHALTGSPFRPGADCRMIMLMKSLEEELRRTTGASEACGSDIIGGR